MELSATKWVADLGSFWSCTGLLQVIFRAPALIFESRLQQTRFALNFILGLGCFKVIFLDSRYW